MNSTTTAAPQQAYTKPELVSLGSAQELTQSINTVSSGDQSFSVLDS